jgi:two-component system, response regulator / RNA-binding antiterminator
MSHALDELNDSAVFLQAPTPMLAVDLSLWIRAVNPAYLAATGRHHDELVGHSFFEVFPDNPEDPAADGVAKLAASFEHVFSHQEPHRMPLQRYDIPGSLPSDPFVRRFWSPVNSPLYGGRHAVVGALHQVVNVTSVLDPILAGLPPADGLDDAMWSRLVELFAHEMLAHDQSRVELGQLRQALTTRIVIEQAKGVLMASWHVTGDDAFETLRGWARSHNLRLHAVCADVVDTLELPPPILGRAKTRAGDRPLEGARREQQ